MAEWIKGLPPEEVDVAWLRLEPTQECEHGDSVGTMLCVRDETGEWSESGDWRGESVIDPVNELGYVITAWQPYVIPQP